MNFARILSNSKQRWTKGVESYQPSRRKLLVGPAPNFRFVFRLTSRR